MTTINTNALVDSLAERLSARQARVSAIAASLNDLYDTRDRETARIANREVRCGAIMAGILIVPPVLIVAAAVIGHVVGSHGAGSRIGVILTAATLVWAGVCIALGGGLFLATRLRPDAFVDAHRRVRAEYVAARAEELGNELGEDVQDAYLRIARTAFGRGLAGPVGQNVMSVIRMAKADGAAAFADLVERASNDEADKPYFTDGYKAGAERIAAIKAACDLMVKRQGSVAQMLVAIRDADVPDNLLRILAAEMAPSAK